MTSVELKLSPLEWLVDPIVLALAAEDSRVLVSHDVNTMENHFRRFVHNNTSPGLILIPQQDVSVGQAIESLVFHWEVLDTSELEKPHLLDPQPRRLLSVRYQAGTNARRASGIM